MVWMVAIGTIVIVVPLWIVATPFSSILSMIFALWWNSTYLLLSNVSLRVLIKQIL